MKKLTSCFLLFTGLTGIGVAQTLPGSPVYLDTSVATIRISIDPDSLAVILSQDSLESDHEYPADFSFENGVIRDSVSMIGFRLRGNTSRYSKKKSFKVSFNTFVSGRSFYGFEKLNLNGEHNDPSIIRSKICWDLFNAFGVPSPRASHVRLYVNGLYRGLYISVEHIDENFALSRFGNNGGNLYKCLYPADLTYRGSAAVNYDSYMNTGERRLVYELKTNEDQWDYSDLAGFITFLNNSPDSTFNAEIETRFNVPGFLKILAVDVAVGMWDDYWFNKNNYYLYRNTATNKFEFLPYDYDNAFGIWWTGIMSGVDWGTRNVNQWGHPSESRPLVQRLLANERYAGWYVYFLDRLLRRYFVPDSLVPRINAIHTMITPAAEADSFRTLDYGYTISQFHDSYNSALGGHVLYGLIPYIATRRTSALQQYALANIAPIIHRQSYLLKGTDSVGVSATVEDDSAGLQVEAVVYSNGLPTSIATLRDDGMNGDASADDGTFTGVIPRQSSGMDMWYAIRASDPTGRVSMDPSNAPALLWRVPAAFTAGPLAINEFMASNSTTNTDPSGEHDDWIEIVNVSSGPVGLKGKYLTDNLSRPNKWALPDTTLPAGGFVLIWADGQPEQGPFHATYKLDKEGEAIGIFDSTAGGFLPLDSLTFGTQENDVSLGRYPDGTGAFVLMSHPTPGASNVITGLRDPLNLLPVRTELFDAYPNPFNPTTVVRYQLSAVSDVRLAIYDVIGREVALLVNAEQMPGRYTIRWNAPGQASGVYFCMLRAGGIRHTKRMMLVR